LVEVDVAGGEEDGIFGGPGARVGVVVSEAEADQVGVRILEAAGEA